MDARIRPATTADLFWLRLLLGQLVEATAAYPIITPRDLEAQTAMLASRLAAQDPTFLCYVAEHEEAIGGFVWGDMLSRTGEPRLYLFVSFFYVVPGWRGEGVGRALSNSIIDAARVKGAQALEFVEQAGDTQWQARGWPIVGIVHSLPIDAAHASVVPTHTDVPNGHS
jgi:GNAT superfamily N-acetyltransferase